MAYKKRIYKTMAGYLKAIGGQVSARDFFSGQLLCGSTPNRYYAMPSAELRAEYAMAFEKYIWSKTNAARLNALCTGQHADFSYLQCFFMTERKNYFSNSLSGEAYEYCKRMFTKSAIS